MYACVLAYLSMRKLRKVEAVVDELRSDVNSTEK
jgi:hypothetical protein